MSCGKIVAQAGHAILDTFLKCRELDVKTAEDYKVNHGIKVTLGVPSLDALLEAKKLADEANIPNTLIYDLGYTQFHGETTITALGIGPARRTEVDHITGSYKLLS